VRDKTILEIAELGGHGGSRNGPYSRIILIMDLYYEIKQKIYG
jgi:hypothetical protein